ncbi:phospho-N-acetylmuramoyl-pentapeptide-transferase [Candidatus Omnitrophota bacterium]
MFYYFFYPLHKIFSFFNIFRYITFRAAMAALTAFLISLALGPAVIRLFRKFNLVENVRKEASLRLDDLHSGKENTPTMGGVMILIALVISTLLWADTTNRFVIIVLASTLWLGLTGFADDYLKQVRRKSKGLTATAKFSSQIILGLVLGTVLFLDPAISTKLNIPFMKGVCLELGLFYLLFVIIVIAGSSNAVNLTDGLDGLATGSVIMVALALSVLCYVSGHMKFSSYLLIPYINGSAELAVFCAAMVGACLGFLWYNCYPASIFMGDVGSLALGGALGTVVLLIKKEFLLVVVGGVFVLEALSVILQVASFKLTGRRIFKIAPLHHHFQFIGWPESKVIVRFWILAIIFAMITLVTLKVR